MLRGAPMGPGGLDEVAGYREREVLDLSVRVIVDQVYQQAVGAGRASDLGDDGRRRVHGYPAGAAQRPVETVEHTAPV